MMLCSNQINVISNSTCNMIRAYLRRSFASLDIKYCTDSTVKRYKAIESGLKLTHSSLLALGQNLHLVFIKNTKNNLTLDRQC